jgi:hypothetical protein
MFFEMTNVTKYQLVHRYLEIAQDQPYNLNWETETIAINANYMLGVFKRNGVEYTKHDIVEDILSTFYDEAKGRCTRSSQKKRGTTQRRANKKSHRVIKENVLAAINVRIKSLVIIDYYYL